MTWRGLDLTFARLAALVGIQHLARLEYLGLEFTTVADLGPAHDLP